MNCHSQSMWAIGISAFGVVNRGRRSALDSCEPLTGAPANGVCGAYYTSVNTAANTATGGNAVQNSATALVAAGSSNMGGTDAMTGGTSTAADCAPPASSLTNESLIDDMENGSGRIFDTDGHLGVWYAFDSDGTVQWPAPTTPGVPVETKVVSLTSARCTWTNILPNIGFPVPRALG